MKFNIDGYESMTPEEKVQALEAYDPTASGYVTKETLDKAAADAARYKKELKDLQSAGAQASAAQKTLEERIAELEKEKAISGAEAKYLGLGYSAELAKSSAQALIDGDFEKLFADQQTFNAEKEKTKTAERMRNMPTPVGGTATHGVDYSKLIAEAESRGDAPAIAYYTRLSQQQTSK